MINFAQYIPMFFLNTSSKLKIFNRISNANIINTPLTFEYNIIAVLSKKKESCPPVHANPPHKFYTAPFFPSSTAFVSGKNTRSERPPRCQTSPDRRILRPSHTRTRVCTRPADNFFLPSHSHFRERSPGIYTGLARELSLFERFN